MVRRAPISVAVCCIAALGLIAIFAHVSREPSYAGHPLSHWLLLTYQTNWDAAIGSPVNPKEQAADAVRHIGTNALPSLMRWIHYKEPAWSTPLYMRLIAISNQRHRPWIARAARPWLPCRPERKDTMAMIGFKILGMNAEPALPELLNLSFSVN